MLLSSRKRCDSWILNTAYCWLALPCKTISMSCGRCWTTYYRMYSHHQSRSGIFHVFLTLTFVSSFNSQSSAVRWLVQPRCRRHGGEAAHHRSIAQAPTTFHASKTQNWSGNVSPAEVRNDSFHRHVHYAEEPLQVIPDTSSPFY